MRVYLDTCALQPPLDDRGQFRVRVEADAVTALLDAVEAGNVDLLSSAALRAESSRVRHRARRDFAAHTLALATRDVGGTAKVEALTRDYLAIGMQPFDALHLASAVVGEADYFCSTDDRLLRLAQKANTQATRVVTPLELAAALDL